MTDTFDAVLATPPLEQRPEPKRDRWGRYMIPHPDTGEPVAWTRAATVTDPDHPDAKKLLDRLAEQAKEHAGASTRANLGTALHAFCEHADLTGQVTAPDPYAADVTAYRDAMAAAGMRIDPAHIERIVIVPELGVAGTFDRLVATPAGRLVIADLKTGRDLSYSWTDISIQLSLYAHATHIYDPATDALTEMPAVDQERALVMHLPVGANRCDLYVVDIAAGWAMAKTCAEVREWRKRKDLAKQLPIATTPVAPVVNEQATPPAPTPSVPVAEPAGEPTPIGALLPQVLAAIPAEDPTPAPAERLAWARSCVAQARDHELLDVLASVWPADVPGFAGDHTHTAAEVDRIEEALRQLERTVELPFAFFAEDPTVERTVPADDPRVVGLLDRFARLPADLRANVAAELERHKVPKVSSGRASGEQVAMVTGWVTAVEAQHNARIEAVEILLGKVASDNVDPDPILFVATGEHTDSELCTADDLDRLTALVGAIDAGVLGPDLAATDAFTGGRTKGELLSLARAVAKAHGLDSPRSAEAALADPLLVAYAALRHGAHGVPS